jgi:hypothetical protein
MQILGFIINTDYYLNLALVIGFHMQARQPAKPARHSPEAQSMADGQGEAARGT